jgi:hypothetical protein
MADTKLKLTDINTTGGTQTRAEINEDIVADYAAAMRAGDAFPSVAVFHDGTDYYLADGFHRVLAATRAGLAEIGADIRKGTRQDALLYSLGANTAHGLRRTNADKRRCVELALAAWPRWSDRRLAETCKVSPDTAGRIRRDELSESDSCPEFTKRVGADGKERAMPAARPGGQVNPDEPESLALLVAINETLPKYFATLDPDESRRLECAITWRFARYGEIWESEIPTDRTEAIRFLARAVRLAEAAEKAAYAGRIDAQTNLGHALNAMEKAKKRKPEMAQAK